MKHNKARVLSKKIFNDIYVEILMENKFNIQPRPGQFIHILTSGTLIRRPFSIAGCTEKWVKILFQIKGPGTTSLAKVKKGMHLDIIGPLGNGFPRVDKSVKVALVAGGMGVAPLLFVASEFISNNIGFRLFYGAKTSKDLLVSVLPDGNYEKILSTDDGSYGEKATVLEIFEKNMANWKPDIVFSAGPFEMLKKLSMFCKQNNINAYLSLENVMFCGLGVCQGCVIETIEGYKRVCKDGPVFGYREIKWK